MDAVGAKLAKTGRGRTCILADSGSTFTDEQLDTSDSSSLCLPKRERPRIYIDYLASETLSLLFRMKLSAAVAVAVLSYHSCHRYCAKVGSPFGLVVLLVRFFLGYEPMCDETGTASTV